MNLISLFVMSLLTQNIILTRFLGMCPFFGTSNKEKSAIGMGLSVTFVVTIASFITYLLYHYLLVPTNTTYLQTVLFILVIACMVQITEFIVKKYFSSLYKILGIYLPLITTNCAVLGITLLNINNQYTLAQAMVFSVGSSLGFTLVIYIFSTIRERIDQCPVPKPFKGYPIAFLTATIMSLLFTRYIGV